MSEFSDGYTKGVNDMIHELSKMSTVKFPHTYLKAVGTNNIELAGQRLKKRLKKKVGNDLSIK